MENGSNKLIGLNEAFEKVKKAQDIVLAKRSVLQEDWKQLARKVVQIWTTLGLSPCEAKVDGVDISISANGIVGFGEDALPSREVYNKVADLATTYLENYAQLLSER